MGIDYKLRNSVATQATVGLGALAMAGAVGCGDDEGKYNSGHVEADWMETDGAAGRINLGEVQKAFKDAKDPSAFEQRLNEIYTGKNLILVKVKKDGDAMHVSGWEDLDSSGTIEDEKDDKLFQITVNKEKKEYDVRGAGVNSHYHHHGSSSGFGGGFFTGYIMGSMMGNMMSGGMYMTPRSHVTVINNHRTTYRSSPAFQQQRQRNSSWQSKQKAKNPAAYKKSQSKASPARKSFQKSTQKSIKSKSRAGGKSGRSGSKGGGFRGGS